MIGLDSSAVIDFFKGNKQLRVVLEDTNEPLVLNRISYLEIMFGIDFSKTAYELEEGFYDDLFKSLLVFELNAKSSKKSSEVLWNLKKMGKTIELLDCTIAGVYLSNGIDKILTRNKKHFENVKGLKVISY